MTGVQRRRVRVFVHLDHGRSLAAWTALHRGGQVLDPDPYGYSAAAARFDLRHSTDRPEGRSRRFVRRGLRYLLGFDVLHAFANRRAMADADVVWTHTEHEHLAIALLQRLGLLRPVPVVAQSIWLWDAWPRMRRARRAVLRWLLATSALHTTHSPANAAAARAAGFAAHVVPFGIEPSALSVADRSDRADGEVRVVALGSDRHRDWALLKAAATLRPGVRVRVLSNRRAAAALQEPGSTRFVVEGGADVDAIREAYAWADVVAVPLRANLHASGYTVCLEGLLSGRPVVASDTGGLGEVFGDLVTLVPVGDAEALADALVGAARAAGRPSGAQLREGVIARGLTADDYAWRHVLLTEAVLEGRPVGAPVSKLAPVAPPHPVSAG